MDYSPMSKSIVRWVIDNLALECNRIVLIHVVSYKIDSAQKKLWVQIGMPLIPLDEFREMNLTKQYEISNVDPEVFELLAVALKVKKVTVLAKVSWGEPREKLCDAVEDLKLDSLVVRSRCFGTFIRMLLGNVRNYVVTNGTKNSNSFKTVYDFSEEAKLV